jgi:hypothetical protein
MALFPATRFIVSVGGCSLVSAEPVVIVLPVAPGHWARADVLATNVAGAGISAASVQNHAVFACNYDNWHGKLVVGFRRSKRGRNRQRRFRLPGADLRRPNRHFLKKACEFLRNRPLGCLLLRLLATGDAQIDFRWLTSARRSGLRSRAPHL